MLFKLLGGAVGPAAAEEEDDGGPFGGGLVVGRLENPELQVDAAYGFVGPLRGAIEDRRVGAGALLLLLLGEERGGTQGGEQAAA